MLLLLLIHTRCIISQTDTVYIYNIIMIHVELCRDIKMIHKLLLLSTNHLDPCYWEGESDFHARDPQAMFPVHLASSSSQRGLSTSPEVTPGYDLASPLCKHDLRKDDLFVLSWTRMRRMTRGSISSELLLCRGGVRSILLLPLVARCLETIYVCCGVCWGLCWL